MKKERRKRGRDGQRDRWMDKLGFHPSYQRKMESRDDTLWQSGKRREEVS